MTTTARSRRLRAAIGGIAALTGMVALVGTAGAAPARARVPHRVAVETREACGQVTGARARCAAVQVLNPDAIVTNDAARLSRGHHRTTTTTSATTTSTSTSTSTSTTSSTSSTTTSSSTTSTSTTTTTAPATTSTTVVTPSCTSAHVGLTPCDLQDAYALPSTTAGAGRTVAIVDAYDDPNAESDLAVYRSAYGLGACTTANGCFRKVDQNGGTRYPRGDTGWAEEISLDLDMVSAACPNCHILLVEARSNGLGDLLTAENTAAALGADVISNSWAASEFSSETAYDGYFHHGIPITASTGDSGYGVGWPAASPYVTAVGGTSLSRAANTRGWTETAWSGAGSGCSAYEAKPAWQADSGCPRRALADVSAIADPSTGVATYDSYNQPGWLVFGGTSVAAPIVASVYALAGNGAAITSPAYAYAHAGSLFDVTSGSNGSCGTYLCNGVTGYDGPTGLGTPNGTGAF